MGRGMDAVSDWRPIETAPRDGTWVLLACPKTQLELCVSMGSYYREEERAENGRFIGGEWTAPDWDGSVSGYLEPTHWMPLPEPPEAP